MSKRKVNKMKNSDWIYEEMTKMNMNMARQAAALYAIAMELNKIRYCMYGEAGIQDDVIEDTFQMYGMEIEDIEPR